MASTPAKTTRRCRVIVFSNFPVRYYEKNLLPRLQEAGADVLRVVNFDRSRNPDVSDADALVAFVEVMSSGQRTRIKDLAQKNGLRFAALARRGFQTWGAHFPPVENLPSNVRAMRPVTHRMELPSSIEPEPASKNLAEPSVTELQELITLFEEENTTFQNENVELVKANAELSKILKEREDRVLHFAQHFEAERKKVVELEVRIKEQTNIRGQLEKELLLAKQNVDALARQVESLKKEPNTEVALPVGSAAAHKAHQTRLKGELFDAHEKIKALEAELARRPVAGKQVAMPPAPAAPAPAFDKAIILAWLNVIRKADKGDASAYRGLLELAAKYGVDPATVLELVK